VIYALVYVVPSAPSTSGRIGSASAPIGKQKTCLKGQVIIRLEDGKAGYLDADLFLHGFA
jgi:hypothetical protein